MLKYTVDQVRKRQTALIGTKGLPTIWWPYSDPNTNDCLGYQLYQLGERSKADVAPHFVSISAFRAWAGWEEPSILEAVPGDLVCENWSTGTQPEHIEYIYSIDLVAKTITTISANTGPKPGVPIPRGVWKKTRPIDDHFLFAIRPPYKDETPTKSRMTEVKIVATYLNRDNVVPDGPRSAAAIDGIEGPNYWTLVQMWGRLHKLYGPTYRIDGVPGPRTRAVEAVIYGTAKKG